MEQQYPQGTIFKHYKGNLYEFLHFATHTETGEDMVVYKALYGTYGIWVRPRAMFMESVVVAGKTVRRFAPVI